MAWLPTSDAGVMAAFASPPPPHTKEEIVCNLLGRNRVDLVRRAVEQGLLSPDAKLQLTKCSLLAGVASLDAVDMMHYLIFEMGVNPNEQWGVGITPLLGALGQQRERAALFMIEEVPGCDVNLRGPGGIGALTSAAMQGMLRVMRALVAKGADVNAIDAQGFPVVLNALLEGQEDAAIYLIEAGASWRLPRAYSIFQIASGKGMFRLLRATVERMRQDGVGEEVVQKELAGAAGAAISTREPIKVLEELVGVGLDAKRASIVAEMVGVGPRGQGAPVRTPLLHMACKWSNTAAAELLVAQGCDPKQADGVCALPIQIAAGVGSLQIVKLLVDRCRVPPDLEENGATALRMAAVTGHQHIVAFAHAARGGPGAHAPGRPGRSGGHGLLAGGGAQGRGLGGPGGARGGGGPGGTGGGGLPPSTAPAAAAAEPAGGNAR